jgi:SAM-dependent methyltransferase
MVEELSETASAFRQSILLLTANRCALFDRLAPAPLSASDVSQRMGWDLRAAEVFLNALTAMGMLRKSEGRFSNTPRTQRLLVRSSPDYQGDILNHDLNTWERWSRVGEVLETGQPLKGTGERRSGEELGHFIRGMANIARLSAIRLLDEVDLSGCRCLLDAGGGPGTYALTACERHPGLEAIVFDLPEVEPIFEEYRGKSDAASRVRFHAGDLHADSVPQGFDAALLSNIIHSWGEDENRAIVHKIGSTLAPGGRFLIKDFFVSEDGTEPTFSALFAVNMLLSTRAGGCYSQSRVESWLREAGCRLDDVRGLTERTSVLVAIKESR